MTRPASLLEKLISVLRSPSPDVEKAQELAETLEAVADASLVPPVESLLKDMLRERNVLGRDLLASVLASIAKQNALPLLLDAKIPDLGEDQESLQSTLAGLIQEFPQAALDTALRLLGRVDPSARAVAVWALGWAGAETARVSLLTATQDEAAAVRAAALGALSSVNAPDVSAALLRGLKDADADVRAVAATHLGYREEVAAVPALIQTLRDEVGYVRAAAAHALGILKDERALEPLRDLQRDPDEYARTIAADALTQLTQRPPHSGLN